MKVKMKFLRVVTIRIHWIAVQSLPSADSPSTAGTCLCDKFNLRLSPSPFPAAMCCAWLHRSARVSGTPLCHPPARRRPAAQLVSRSTGCCTKKEITPFGQSWSQSSWTVWPMELSSFRLSSYLKVQQPEWVVAESFPGVWFEEVGMGKTAQQIESLWSTRLSDMPLCWGEPGANGFSASCHGLFLSVHSASVLRGK